MQSTISKGASESDSGMGYVLGAGSYFNLVSMGLPSRMNGGVQYVLFSREADFGFDTRYVGSHQVHLFMGVRF